MRLGSVQRHTAPESLSLCLLLDLADSRPQAAHLGFGIAFFDSSGGRAWSGKPSCCPRPGLAAGVGRVRRSRQLFGRRAPPGVPRRMRFIYSMQPSGARQKKTITIECATINGQEIGIQIRAIVLESCRSQGTYLSCDSIEYSLSTSKDIRTKMCLGVE
jgi:hypothetical protein